MPPSPPPDPALLAIAALGTRIDDPNAALGEILRVVARELGADSASLFLLNPDSGKLEIEASQGLPTDGDLSLSPGQGLPGWAALHARPVLAPEAAADPRFRATRPGIGCQMAAPLLSAEGAALGVVSLERNAPGGFGPADLARLARLGEEAALVLGRLWQLDHLREKAHQLEALTAAGQALVSKLEQQELFDALTRDTRHMMRGRACALYLYLPEAGAVRLASFSGTSLVPLPAGQLPLGSCLVASAIHTRRSVAFADLQSPEFHDLADLPRDESLRSVLATPVAYEGEVFGVLALFTAGVRRFDNDEKRLCAALAGLGAVALQNARLYSRVFQSEASLRKNEQLTTLGLLAAEIAHEIRNPLTVLKLLHGGLGLDFADGDPRRTDMRVIGEKLDQLEAIVSRVLNFAKAPSSLHVRFGLAEIVEDTLVLVRLKLAQNKVQVIFDPPARAYVVDGHKAQLQQVLLNLLLNAMQAMPGGGAITLAIVAGEAQTVRLDVSDTGSGIPEAIRSRVFDSFLSGRPDGTGLGLAIAKRIMLSHHGDIAVAETSPAGTTLRLTLPLAKG
ncbi:MAG TPA: GAF domain-containing protein [Opitutaceae bacterium]|nr:GAF domain-containing protein [Opitutaceae bacterium]